MPFGDLQKGIDIPILRQARRILLRTNFAPMRFLRRFRSAQSQAARRPNGFTLQATCIEDEAAGPRTIPVPRGPKSLEFQRTAVETARWNVARPARLVLRGCAISQRTIEGSEPHG